MAGATLLLFFRRAGFLFVGWCVESVQAYAAGPHAGVLFAAGLTAGQIYRSGSVERQGAVAGVVGWQGFRAGFVIGACYWSEGVGQGFQAGSVVTAGHGPEATVWPFVAGLTGGEAFMAGVEERQASEPGHEAVQGACRNE